MTELTKEQKRAIIETAKDLNKAMDLDPKIEIEFKSDAEGKVREEEESKFVLQLVEDVVKAANLLESTDQIKDETIGVLEMLEIDGIRDKMKAGKSKEKKEGVEKKKVEGEKKERVPVSEACELYVEQEIESGLAEGKTPYKIGQELSNWIAKLFEVRLKPDTLKKRAERKKKKETIKPEPSQKKKKEKVKDVGETKEPESVPSTERGGKREGAGRPQIDKKEIIGDDFKVIWESMIEEIRKAKKENWQITSQEAALYYVQLLLDEANRN